MDSLKPGLKAFLLYLAVISIFYSPVVFGGKSLLPSLYQPNGAIDGFHENIRPETTFNVDIATPAYYESPINSLTGSMYLDGQLPLWNPYQAIGTPLAAQYSTRAFFPYQMIENISPVWSWDFFMLARLVLAGFFTYLFLVSTGLGFTAAFGGGLFYMLSGPFVWFINLEQMANAAFVLPLAMYSASRLVNGNRRDIAFSAVCFALLLLAGQPEVALYCSLLAFSYFMFITVKEKGFSGVVPNFLKFSLAYFLGLLIAAPLILPFLELILRSHHIHPFGGSMGMQTLTNWRSIYAILVPGATELPLGPDSVRGLCPIVDIGGEFFRYLPVNGVWDSLGGYIGVMPVFLILAGLFSSFARGNGRHRSVALFFAVFGLSVILKNLGVKPFHWLGALPLFDQVWSLRWAGPAWAFSLCAAAAFGLQSILDLQSVTKVTAEGKDIQVNSGLGSYFTRGPQKGIFFAFIIIAAFFAAGPLKLAIELALIKEEVFNANMAGFVVPSMLSSSTVSLVLLLCAFSMLFFSARTGRGGWGVLALAGLELWWAIPRGYSEQWLLYKWVPLSIGFFTAFFLFLRKWKLSVIGVVSFFIAFTMIDTLSPRSFPKRFNPFKPAPYVEYIQTKADNSRVMGINGELLPNFASAFALADVRYVNSLLPAEFNNFRTKYMHAKAIDEEPVSSLWFTGRPERCKVPEKARPGVYEAFYSPAGQDILSNMKNYSYLGVKYIVASSDSGLKDTGLELVYDKDVKIYENPKAFDRAYVAYALERAGSFEEAQEMAMSPGFDLRTKAVVEDALPSNPSHGKGNYRASIKEYAPGRVIIDVQTDMDGLLVLTDAYYPGWQARVNGAPEDISRVNGLVRGVAVRKGESTVEFTYRPVSFKAGAAGSFFGLAACAFMVSDSRRRIFRKR